ncbi:MAG: DUF4397 domain-containing protein [Fimbriimonadaceae bacterium]|nr:DUF4397 domain-containing protein [Fimbriimonadaceae bacterium]
MTRWLLPLLAALLCLGCSDNSLKGKFRLLVASPALGTVDLYVDGKAELTGITVAASAYRTLSSKSHVFSLREAGTSRTLWEGAFDVERRAEYTMLVTGAALAPVVGWVKDDNEPASTDQAKVRVWHGSAMAGTVDVFLTGRTTKLEDASPSVLSIANGQRTQYLLVDTASARVRATPEHEVEPVLADADLTLGSKQTHTIVIVDDPASSSKVGFLTVRDG